MTHHFFQMIWVHRPTRRCWRILPVTCYSDSAWGWIQGVLKWGIPKYPWFSIYSKIFVPDLPALGVFPFWDILGNLHIVLRPQFQGKQWNQKGNQSIDGLWFPDSSIKGTIASQPPQQRILIQEQCSNTWWSGWRPPGAISHARTQTFSPRFHLRNWGCSFFYQVNGRYTK